VCNDYRSTKYICNSGCYAPLWGGFQRIFGEFSLPLSDEINSDSFAVVFTDGHRRYVCAGTRVELKKNAFCSAFSLENFSLLPGNVLHAFAINKKSVPLAIAGRFVIGFSSLEILHREIVSACLPAHVVSESALLMLSRIGGIVCGLFVGSATEAVPIALQRLGVRTLQASNWLMILLWMIHLVRVLVQVRPKAETRTALDSGSDITDQEEDGSRASNNESDSDSSSSDGHETPSSMLYRKTAGTPKGPIPAAFGGGERPSDDMESVSTRESKSFSHKRIKQRRQFRQRMTLGRFRKLFAFHIGIPVSLAIVFLSTFGLETFFTATPLITHRYFGWSGARAGTFLGVLAFFMFPVQYVCAIVARRYEERTVLKVSGTVLLLNESPAISLLALLLMTDI